MLNDAALKEAIRQFYGRVSQGMPGFRPRFGQREMIAGIANTLARTDRAKGEEPNGRNIIVVEGKTGVGKTVGYLIPALVMAKSLGKQLVISTGTVALQEQLYQRDLPALLPFLEGKLTYALAKGRGRYVCPSRLFQVAGAADQDGLFDGEQAPVWDRKPEEREIRLLRSLVKDFDAGKWSGDRDEQEAEIPSELWSRVTTDSGGCSGRHCAHFQACPHYKARNQIANADVIVANHDLVLSCLASESNLLPDPESTIYVFDEAHHLPDVAVSRFAKQAPVFGSIRWLERIPPFLARVLSALPAGAVMPGAGESMRQLQTKLDEFGHGLRRGDLFASKALHRFADGKLDPSTESLAAEIAKLAEEAVGIASSLEEKLDKALEEGTIAKDSGEAHLREMGGFCSKLKALKDVWMLFLEERPEGVPPLAKWIERTADGNDFVVNASPITASAVLRNNLWTKASAVVLTSATMTTLGEFRFFLKKTGLAQLREVTTLAVQSPFDYATQGEICLPRMRTDPKQADHHTVEIASMLPELVEPWKRGLLALFASRRQMESVYAQMPESLKSEILLQGSMSRIDLIKAHKERVAAGQRSVLFGLAGLGEGLDLPGQLCEHVLIAKIPFPPPDSPLEEALAEWVERNRGNPFVEITLPKAGLILVQWVGRLIRTEADRGRITILDRRVLTKAYGSRLLHGLPAFRRVA